VLYLVILCSTRTNACVDQYVLGPKRIAKFSQYRRPFNYGKISIPDHDPSLVRPGVVMSLERYVSDNALKVSLFFAVKATLVINRLLLVLPSC
jgi:hypothetical protein